MIGWQLVAIGNLHMACHCAFITTRLLTDSMSLVLVQGLLHLLKIILGVFSKDSTSTLSTSPSHDPHPVDPLLLQHVIELVKSFELPLTLRDSIRPEVGLINRDDQDLFHD